MIPIRDTVPRRRAPVVTWSIIAVNVAVFINELSLPPEELQRFVFAFGLVPARLGHPEWASGFPLDDYWPLVTSMFLHGGWAHIVGNMWALWIFGDNVEDRMGPWRYLAFYLLTGVAAGVTQWLTNAQSTIPTVGASGAIAGIFGAYLFMFPRARIIAIVPILFFPFFFEVPAVLYLAFWLASQLVGGTIASLAPSEIGGVAWWAHVGGFATGALLHRLFLLRSRGPPRRRFEPDELGIEGAWSS